MKDQPGLYNRKISAQIKVGLNLKKKIKIRNSQIFFFDRLFEI